MSYIGFMTRVCPVCGSSAWPLPDWEPVETKTATGVRVEGAPCYCECVYPGEQNSLAPRPLISGDHE